MAHKTFRQQFIDIHVEHVCGAPQNYLIEVLAPVEHSERRPAPGILASPHSRFAMLNNQAGVLPPGSQITGTRRHRPRKTWGTPRNPRSELSIAAPGRGKDGTRQPRPQKPNRAASSPKFLPWHAIRPGAAISRMTPASAGSHTVPPPAPPGSDQPFARSRLPTAAHDFGADGENPRGQRA